MRSRERLPLEVAVVLGEVPRDDPVRMNGLAFEVDLLRGQKTGIYLDQRENYLAAARYAPGRALDCFTSTGGFALHLAAACESVEAVDSLRRRARSRFAQCLRERHYQRRIPRRRTSSTCWPAYASARREFSMVVLDPPAFTKSRRAVEDAARGYKEINLRALRLLGARRHSRHLLLLAPCERSPVTQVVAEASLDAGRTLRVLERRTQARIIPSCSPCPRPTISSASYCRSCKKGPPAPAQPGTRSQSPSPHLPILPPHIA